MEGVSQTIPIRWFLHCFYIILPFYFHSQIPLVSYHSSHIFIYPQELKDSLTKQQDIIYMFFFGGDRDTCLVKVWFLVLSLPLSPWFQKLRMDLPMLRPCDLIWQRLDRSNRKLLVFYTSIKSKHIYIYTYYVYTYEIIHIPCLGCWSHVLEFICK